MLLTYSLMFERRWWHDLMTNLRSFLFVCQLSSLQKTLSISIQFNSIALVCSSRDPHLNNFISTSLHASVWQIPFFALLHQQQRHDVSFPHTIYSLVRKRIHSSVHIWEFNFLRATERRREVKFPFSYSSKNILFNYHSKCF